MKKESEKEEAITFKKSTLWKAAVVILAIIVVWQLFFKTGTGVGAAVPSPAAPPPPTAAVSAAELEDDDAFLGNENAPLTIVEFSDFQCPFCRKFWKDTLPSIKKDYIDTGKVKFVYRDFPLTSIHPGAQPAAEASECAREQDRFWQYHDKIFEEQDKRGQGTVQFGVADLKQWAADLGLDTGKFNKCLDSGKYSAEVNKDLIDAQRAGGQGTPHFVIGNTPVSGAMPYSSFKPVIDAELARS